MRPWHWAKNALVFVPVLTSHRYLEAATLVQATVATAALCLVASATYLVNDVLDLDNDRRHPVKRLRPIASGSLAVATAHRIAIGLLAAGLSIGFVQGAHVGFALVTYAAGSLLYSKTLKSRPGVDVIALVALYLLRIVIGMLAIGSAFSPWLFGFGALFFASLALAKRYVEVTRYGEARIPVAGRGYALHHALPLRIAGRVAGMGAVALFAAYLHYDAVPTTLYARPGWLWAIVPLVLAWMFHIWHLARKGVLRDDPVDYALRDPVSLTLGAAVMAAFLAAG
jgi:4-hydroxybenzoate polyprenyltransferase